MRSPPHCLRPIALLVATACGPAAAVGSDATSGTSGASATSGSPTGSSDDGSDTRGFDSPPPPGCESARVAGSDPIDPNDCATFATDPDAVPSDVTLRIINRRGAPIMVPPLYSGVAPVRWVDVTGTAGGRELRDIARCAFTDAESYWLCDWFETGRGDACRLIASDHPSICIEPGGYFETTWTAWVLASATVPDTCAAAGAGEACEVAFPAPPGTYEMTTRAQLLTDDACACRTDEHGSCEGNSIGLEPDLFTNAAWDGTCDEVTLVFD